MSNASSTAVPKKERRWRRRITTAVLTVIAFIVLMRVIIAIALPPLIRGIAARYDLNCSYERAELYLLSGNVGIWRLTVTPKSSSASIIDAEYCRADISALNLLRGQLVVYRLEADGVDATMERGENGEFPMLERLIGGPFKSANTSAAPKKTVLRDVTLDLPLRVDSIRVNRARAHLIDRTVSPPIDTQLDVNMRVSDLGSTKRPTRFLLDMTSPPLLDTIRVEGEGTAHGKDMDAKMQVLVRGIHPRPAAGYLTALGFRPAAQDISMHMNATVKTQAVETGPTTQPSGLKGAIVLSDITATADGVEAAGLDNLTINIDSLTPQRLRLGKLSIENVRARANRTADGAFRVAGLELIAAASAGSPSQSAGVPMMPWSLAELSIRNVRASFHDDAVTPQADLALSMEQVTVNNLASDGSDLPTQVTMNMTMPGLAQTVRMTGSAIPHATKRILDLKVVAEGIRPDALRPYLDAAGLESQIKSGTLTCNLRASLEQSADGKINADARFGDVNFSDGRELFTFDGVTLAGAIIDPKANSVRVESIDIAGPKLHGGRDAAGVAGALGLVFKPSTPQPVVIAVRPLTPTTQPARAIASVATSNPPKIEIGRLTWKGIDLRYDDQFTAPPTIVTLGDSGLELTDIHIDPDPKSSAGPGKLRAWLTAPGVIGNIAVTGTIASRGNSLALDFDVLGKGLKAGQLTPYLKAAGIEPTLKDGSFQLHSHVALSSQAGVIAADAAVENVKFADAATELAGVDSVSVSGVEIHPEETLVGAVEINKPRITAGRDADGAFVLAGTRIVSVPATQPAPVMESESPSLAVKLPQVALGRFRVKDATLNWADRAAAVNTAAHANVQLDNLVMGREAEPAQLTVVVAIDRTMENLTATGQIWAPADSPRAAIDMLASGIHPSLLNAYLPPGTRTSVADGRFHVKLDAGLSPADKGGLAAKLIVSDLDYRDAAITAPLFHFDTARIIASRIDPPGKVIAIDEISLAGLQTGARKSADGSLQLLGLTIGQPPAQAMYTLTEPAAQTASAIIPPAKAVAPTTNVVELIARDRQPLITLEKLDLNLRSISFVDESRPQASPLALAEVKLRNRKPVELLGDSPASRPPAELELTGRIDPLVKSFVVNTIAAPFGSQPSLQIDVNASGINGDGAVALVPELKPSLDGSKLTDGRFNTHLQAQAQFARLAGGQYDFARPFDAEFNIRPIEFRAAPGEPVLAGLEEIRGEGVHVDPATGGVRVRSIEITKPIALAWRDQEGVHVLGCVLKVATTQPSTQPTPPPVQTAPKSVASAPPPASKTKPSAEMRIDKLIVSGLDVRLEDRTCAPPLLVPLNSLDVEVRDISNMALYEDRPIRFNVLVGAGKVPLPGGKQEELFSQVTANGSVSLYPTVHGWIKSSVSGFELVSLHGLAKEQKVDLGGGVFDCTVDVRIKDDGSLDTRSRFAFTDLKVSEPPGGPIQRTLQLPTPLDTVILVLQDASGAITVPVNMPIKQGEVSRSSIAGAAVGAFGGIVTTAVASSPLKVAGGVGSMLGMSQKEKEKGSQPAGEIGFAPAAGELPAASKQTLDQLLERLRRQDKLEVTLKHELGGGDITRAAVLANPSPEDCLAIAAQLRQRKQKLLAERSNVAATARASIASLGAGQSADSVERLRAIDRELAATEDSLDRVYDLLRPGASRQADRRTRAAAIDIAQARLDAIQAILLSSGIEKIDQRVRVTRAQFIPADGNAGGKVTMTVLEKKKP